MVVDSEYLSLGGKDVQDSVKRVLSTIKKNKIRFIAIAFRGVSGALVAPAVAAALGKNLVLVRKRSERRHTIRNVEGETNGNYIIIDDFLETGRTCKTIISEIAKVDKGSRKRRRVGVILYKHEDIDSSGHMFTEDTGVRVYTKNGKTVVRRKKRK